MPIECASRLVAYFCYSLHNVFPCPRSFSFRIPCLHGFALHHGESWPFDPAHKLVIVSLQLFYSIILLCLGRHPLQNPHYIKPEIEKLPKTIVDRIPLVIYIPPPPEDDGKAQPISLPKPVHIYPPKPSAPRTPRRRFAFFRRKPANKIQEGVDTLDGKQSTKSDAKDPETWEDNWEQCKYPFVRLEGNRAACAICLMDFEEPKRLNGGMETSAIEEKETEESAIAPELNTPRQREEEVEIPVERITEEERIGLPRLEDAGAGPQPLRLLACGHVFHVRVQIYLTSSVKLTRHLAENVYRSVAY